MKAQDIATLERWFRRAGLAMTAANWDAAVAYYHDRAWFGLDVTKPRYAALLARLAGPDGAEIQQWLADRDEQWLKAWLGVT